MRPRPKPRVDPDANLSAQPKKATAKVVDAKAVAGTGVGTGTKPTPSPTKESAELARTRAGLDAQQLQSRADARLVLRPAAQASGVLAQPAPGVQQGTTAQPKVAVDPALRAEAQRNFDQVTSPTRMADLPATVGLPDALDRGLQKAWAGSLPGGRSQEQGGIAVQKADGTYEFRASKPGNSGSITLNYGDVKPGEKLVAGAHTHPYDKTEGSVTGVPFSGADLANIVGRPDVIRAVQSGDKQFVAVPSREFQDRVAALDTPGREALAADMKKLHEDTFKAASGDFASRVDAAVRAVSRTYGLGYYSGTDGMLTRVVP